MEALAGADPLIAIEPEEPDHWPQLEAGPHDTPFLQIGETKYGKPVLDPMLTYETPMAEALKIALISFSATMRSNLAVGLPVDIATIRSGVSDLELIHPIEVDDEYYSELTNRWSNALRAAAAAIPLPQYASQPEQELRS